MSLNHNMALFQPIGIIILAGGKSSRMGQDKGLMFFRDKPMIESVIATAAKVSTDIMIVANDERYAQFGYKVVKDDFHEKGPLAGIYTGLHYSAFDYNLVLSCDIPFIHESVLEFLTESCAGYDVTVAVSEEKMHPLIGVYHKRCLPVIEQKLKQDTLKVIGIFDQLKIRKVDMADFLPENFRNINSPLDL